MQTLLGASTRLMDFAVSFASFYTTQQENLPLGNARLWARKPPTHFQASFKIFFLAVVINVII